MLNTARKIDKLSEYEYLQGELISPVKHELVDGVAYAMAGASANHERSKRYFMGDEIVFDSVDLSLSVAEIYHRVQNTDVLEYQAQE